jgi:hypothetical protein
MNSPVISAPSLDEVSLPRELPPLVLVAFVRPELLAEVLAAIRQQSLLPPQIIAFIDGARSLDDLPLIEQCVSLLEQFSTFIPVHIVRRTCNLGCDQNVILGLTEVLSSYAALVYLEDDTVPNSYFYDRMCRLLTYYADCQQICSVSAYANPSAELTWQPETDFVVSNRVFCWGFGTWADRWQEMDLVNQTGQYNPFGSFDKIPAISQTEMTIINQFWLEKNQKTDWVITFTLAALYHQKVHLIPTASLIHNIGFGHPHAKTYKGNEQKWVNAKYDAHFYPNRLPPTLIVHSDCTNLANHLLKYPDIWLNLRALLNLLKQANSVGSTLILLRIFLTRLPVLVRRWRSGLPT